MKKILTIATALTLAASITSCNGAGETTETTGETKVAADSLNPVIENIMTRTSIRKFTSEPVSDETLECLVRAGMAAPSAMDKRPWAFIVITDRDVLDSLRVAHPFSNLKTATAAIVVCGDMDKTIEGHNSTYWIQDCSAATENILLAAHSLGLGAVWCGIYPNEDVLPEVSKVLGVPSNIVPMSLVTLGYPDENPAPKDKWNKDNVHYQKW